MLSESAILDALRGITDVLGNGNLVDAGRVKKVVINGSTVSVMVDLPTSNDSVKQRIEDEARAAVKSVGGVGEVLIMTKSLPAEGQAGARPAPNRSPFDDQAPIEGVKNIIAISSAKGGVGKSTVAVNLALALARQGAKVGLMDADVYGPSLHVLLGVEERPGPGRNKEIAPIRHSGLKLMSLGFLTDKGQPVIWRGPIVMGVVKKFLQDVEWGDLDYLMIDMPPGTGDAQLTLVQTVPLTGAVIVTTPSELALVDAEKGLQMYRSVEAPVLGIIENMSYFVCPHCNERSDIFDYGGARDIAQRLDTEFLGEIPLHPDVRAGGDRGQPIMNLDPESPISREFLAIAGRLKERCPA